MGDWSSETNWSIASGSLRNCIAFQSTLSLLDEDGNELDSKSPLLLHPPTSPDSPPCEINIYFTDKHELRQVYVRSTARVYEIYYAPNLNTNNEYLCTVRCGVAVRDGQIQQIESLPQENLKNEDDWVEVKVPDPDRTTNTTRDLYEATAEINDANPCISVTLRLLSLQSKGCVYVDEIYVFADPVDAPESESQQTHHQNSPATSLMTMFLPSLMHLSKTTDLSRLNTTATKEKQYVSEDDSVMETQPKGKTSTTDPQQVKLKEVNGPSQIAETTLGGNVERALEQLISRIDKIEQICLGFQDKMVMPISSMEVRLQRVEQQLDTLTKKLQNSESPSCCRISAPDASCIESDANSSDNCFTYAVTSEIESRAKHLHIQVEYVSPHDISDSANTTQMLPGLVVKAPEFPDGEDEEDNASGQEINPSNDKGKHSIDDALSSALANFLSSSCPSYTQSLTFKAPEFSNEDEIDHEIEIESSNEIEENGSVGQKKNHIQLLTSPDIPLESGEKLNRDYDDQHREETAQEAEQYTHFCSGEGDLAEVCVKANIVAEHNPRTAFSNNFEEEENETINDHKSDGLSSNRSDISNDLLDNETVSGSSIAQEGVSASTDLAVATQVPEKASHEDIIENVLGFSLASSIVDFEIPLLDVKFISQTGPVTEPFLEALLDNTPQTSSRDPYPSVKERNDDLSFEEHSNLVSIDDGELVTPASDSQFAVDNDYCTPISMPVNIGGDNLPEDHKRNLDQISTDSTPSLI